MKQPCFFAAFAVATSPSAWNIRWPAHDVTKKGSCASWPRIVVRMSMSLWPTPWRTAWRSSTSLNAATERRSDRSASAPPAR